MTFFLDLFTPETWDIFRNAGASVTGFRTRQRNLARERVKRGDIFICYMTRLSRWCGAVQVESAAYDDNSPIYDDPDPFTVRFRVRPLVVLAPETSIPIRDENVWSSLTITKDHRRGSATWTGFFRGSLNRFEEGDGNYLLKLLKDQKTDSRLYQFTEKDQRELRRKAKIRTLSRDVDVEVPDDEDSDPPAIAPATATTDDRESILVQAKVARIGAEMGFHIWIPKNDRARVMNHVPPTTREMLLEVLPLNYNDTTLRTVEQIDVLWLKGRSMARAFEVEHTTAVYSGLLRMADLLALQPNMNIRLHIVAPPDKREKVLREIRRPVFSLLDRGPLYDQCSFLSYEAIDSLVQTEHLSHMSDSILDEYEESAEVSSAAEQRATHGTPERGH